MWSELYQSTVPVNKLLKIAQHQKRELDALRREVEKLSIRVLDLETENDQLRIKIVKLGGTVPNEKLTTT